MKIPNEFIEKQKQGISFFKNLSNDFESVQSIAIQTIIAANNISFFDKESLIYKLKELIENLVKDIDNQKNRFFRRHTIKV